MEVENAAETQHEAMEDQDESPSGLPDQAKAMTTDTRPAAD
jgi:hypothetical protein